MVRILTTFLFLVLFSYNTTEQYVFDLDKEREIVKFISSLERECTNFKRQKHWTIDELNHWDSLVEIIDVYKGIRTIRRWKTGGIVDPGIIYLIE